MRRVWPEYQPLFVRISATDWVAGGWDIDEAVELCRPAWISSTVRRAGTCRPRIPVAPGYQVPFAERIRREAGLATGAVGMITTPAQADEIVRRGRADSVRLARELLRDPYWPLRAARELGHLVP